MVCHIDTRILLQGLGLLTPSLGLALRASVALLRCSGSLQAILVEPRLTESESVVLPLDDPPINQGEF